MKFQKLTSDSIPEIAGFYTMRGNKTCESSVLDEYLWKDLYHVEYCVWESRALLSQMQFSGERYAGMPLCRAEDLPEAFAAMEYYMEEELGLPFAVDLADEESLRILRLPEDRYHISEDEDSRDYLYSRQALLELKGEGLSDKRNRIRQFLRKYGSRYTYTQIRENNWKDVWEFLKQWLDIHGDCDETLAAEIDGIYNILRHMDRLPLRSGVIYVDGEVEAFSMGCYNPRERMAVISVEKANPDIHGMYQFINQQFLLHGFPEALIVNREDDLGDSGIREAKLSYEPIGFAKKYRIRKKYGVNML